MTQLTDPLVGAHSTSKQFFVDASAAGAPQDSTPGVWDVKFYNQTVENTSKKVFRLQSDMALSKDSRISAEWTKFRAPNGVGQERWNEVRSEHSSAMTLQEYEHRLDATRTMRLLIYGSGC